MSPGFGEMDLGQLKNQASVTYQYCPEPLNGLPLQNHLKIKLYFIYIILLTIFSIFGNLMLSYKAIAQDKTIVAVQIKYNRINEKTVKKLHESGFNVVRFGVKYVGKRNEELQIRQLKHIDKILLDNGVRPLITVIIPPDIMISEVTGRYGAYYTEADLNIYISDTFRNILNISYEAFGERAVGYEIWNEPEHSRFWNKDRFGSIDTYSDALCNAIESSLVTKTYGLAYSSEKYALNSSNMLVTRCIDKVSFHYYSSNNTEFINSINAIRAKYGKNIAVSEVGDPMLDGNQLDSNLKKVIICVIKSCDLISIYEWANSPNEKSERERNFGLLDDKSEIKNSSGKLFSFLKQYNSMTVVEKGCNNILCFVTLKNSSELSTWFMCLKERCTFKKSSKFYLLKDRNSVSNFRSREAE